MTSPADPLRRVARALGPVRENIVFLGGAIAPLLQTDPPMPRARVTDDVGALLVSASYTEASTIEATVEARGFRRDTSSKHAHRWITPDGDAFDLVPLGKHLGGTGSALERLAADSATTTELEPGVPIRHVTAPAFLALKLAAHNDRFRDDPFGSRDLQDAFAVIASRPAIVAEMREAPEKIRVFAAEELSRLRSHPDAEELAATHLNDARPLSPALEATLARIREMAQG